MKIYYINLKKSTERKHKLTKQLKKMSIPFERVNAVYGKDMTESEIDKLCFQPTGILCSRSIIGCYSSHLKAWRKFLKDGEDYGIIMEDDCILHKNFEKEVLKIVKENRNWDFMYLGHYELFGSVPVGFHCYMINQKSVRKLLVLMKKMYYHIDLQFYLTCNELNVFFANKKLAKQTITSDASTQNINFPSYTNKLLDSCYTEDSISPSYILSSPLIKIPVVEYDITLYLVVFIILSAFTSKNLVLLYLLAELQKEESYHILLTILFVMLI